MVELVGSDKETVLGSGLLQILSNESSGYLKLVGQYVLWSTTDKSSIYYKYMLHQKFLVHNKVSEKVSIMFTIKKTKFWLSNGNGSLYLPSFRGQSLTD